MRPSTRSVLFGGPPGWVLRAGGKAAAIDIDLAGGRVYGGTLATLISCSRAAQETVTWSDGHLSYAVSNASAISDLGLQAWAAGTNLALHSQDTTGWSTNSGTTTIASNQGTAPDGNNTASSLIPAASTTQHELVSAGITTVAGSTYTLSAAFKQVSGTQARFIHVGVVTASHTNGFWQEFDLQSGTATANKGNFGNGTMASASITALTNGWYLLVVTGVPTTTLTTTFIDFFMSSVSSATFNPSFTGDGTSVMQWWGVDYKLGSFPTPYVPTTTGSATRALDNTSLLSAILTLLEQPQGTIIFRTNQFQAARNAALLGVGNAAVVGLQYTSANKLQTGWGGSNLATGNTATLTGANKAGLRWSASGRGIVLNGGTIASDATTLTAITQANLGVLSDGTLAADGIFPRISGFAEAMSDTAFQAATT